MLSLLRALRQKSRLRWFDSCCTFPKFRQAVAKFSDPFSTLVWAFSALAPGSAPEHSSEKSARLTLGYRLNCDDSTYLLLKKYRLVTSERITFLTDTDLFVLRSMPILHLQDQVRLKKWREEQPSHHHAPSHSVSRSGFAPRHKRPARSNTITMMTTKPKPPLG